MNANLKIWLLIFGSIIVFTSPSTAAVTLDEIHNSVMALVRSYALLDNKLERHEQRERLLGEILKKSLVTLQRGQREFDSMKGSFERLEQRVSEVESFLINKDESNRVQQKTIAEAIASIHDWMVKNKKDSEDKAASCFSSSSDEDEDVSKKIDDLNANIGQLRKEVAEIKEKSQNNEAKVQKLFVDTMDIFEAKTNSASIQLTKIDEKLEGYISGTATTAAPPHNSEWETQVQTSLGEIITTLNTVKEPTPIVFDRSFFEEIGNETKASIERSKTQILESSDKNFAKTASRIKELSETFSSSMSELSSKIGKVSDRPVIVQSNSDGGVNMDSLKSELAVLEHFNVSLQQTSENVLNIKNRLEFQIHQIVLEVTDSVNENIKELNTNMNKKIETIVYSLNKIYTAVMQVEQKLDHHDAREKSLGEILRKSISQLPKGQTMEIMSFQLQRIENMLASSNPTAHAAIGSRDSLPLIQKLDEMNNNIRKMQSEMLDLKEKGATNDAISRRLLETIKRQTEINKNVAQREHSTPGCDGGTATQPETLQAIINAKDEILASTKQKFKDINNAVASSSIVISELNNKLGEASDKKGLESINKIISMLHLDQAVSKEVSSTVKEIKAKLSRPIEAKLSTDQIKKIDESINRSMKDVGSKLSTIHEWNKKIQPSKDSEIIEMLNTDRAASKQLNSSLNEIKSQMSSIKDAFPAQMKTCTDQIRIIDDTLKKSLKEVDVQMSKLKESVQSCRPANDSLIIELLNADKLASKQLSSTVQEIKTKLSSLPAEAKLSKDEIKKIDEAFKNSIKDIDNKVAKLQESVQNIPPPANNNQIMEMLNAERLRDQNIESELKNIKIQLKPIESTPDRNLIKEIGEKTVNAISNLKAEMLEKSDTNVAKCQTISEVCGNNTNAITDKIAKLQELIENNRPGNDSKVFETLTAHKAILENLKALVQETGDNVESTKRKLDVNLLQIGLDVNNATKVNIKQLSDQMNEELDALNQTNLDKYADIVSTLSSIIDEKQKNTSTTIIANRELLLTALSAKIENEISPLWRQFSIIFQDIQASRKNTEKILNFSDTYLLTTPITLAEIAIQVAAMTARIEEMYTDVNYLQGRSALMKQEFNEMKLGLGEALENLKAALSSDTAKENLDKGTGPHELAEKPKSKRSLVARLRFESK